MFAPSFVLKIRHSLTLNFPSGKLQAIHHQQLLDDFHQHHEELRQERDHYKQERNEYRERQEQMARSFMDWRMESDNDRSKMKMDIARLGRKVEAMRPFICGDMRCKRRQLVTISDEGVVESANNVTANSRVSLPIASPTLRTRSVFQVEARQVPIGKPVAK